MTAQYIIITSIFPPTEAVRRFARLEGWQLVVVGDRKTPADWSCAGVRFLSATDQAAHDSHLARTLPWNHYCRKMLGYVEAIKGGADVIVDTDDDNIPKPDWRVPEWSGRFAVTEPEQGFVNVYKHWTGRHIWPRGFPLNLITDERALVGDHIDERQIEVGVWQGLADGDPDVDAIYRLTDNEPCRFDRRAPLVLAPGTLCPFNSQNTAFRRELFPLLYLPAHVTFRFTDILRGLVAQPLMWARGFALGFTEATVEQERNPHNYLKDFESEIPCYLYPERVVETVAAGVSAARSLPDNLFEAYRALAKQGIVADEELETLGAWLKDVS